MTISQNHGFDDLIEALLILTWLSGWYGTSKNVYAQEDALFAPIVCPLPLNSCADEIFSLVSAMCAFCRALCDQLRYEIGHTKPI